MKRLALCIAALGKVLAYGQVSTEETILQPIKNIECATPHTVQPGQSPGYGFNRITRGGSRWYSYLETKDKYNVDIQGLGSMITNNNLASNLIWQDSTMLARFSSGGTIVLDGIWLKHFSQTLDVSAPLFNKPELHAGEIGITNANAYVVDSFAMFYTYNRVANKPNIVDTLIISLAYGNGSGNSDLKSAYWTNSATATNHGVDTLRVYRGWHNFSTNAIQGTTTKIFKIPLTAASANDTASNGFNYLQIPVNLAVPAGNKVGATVFFKSGDVWTPNVDSVTNFNHIRLHSFEENINGFGSYYKDDYNCSHIMTHDTTGWGVRWKPSFAFGAGFQYENHWWAYHITSSAATIIQQVGISQHETLKVKIYPNPSSGLVNLRLPIGSRVEVTDVCGKVIRSFTNTSELYSLNMSNCANGTYFVKTSNGGIKNSQRLVISK